MQPTLSILLVNWNTREMTLECLRSIYDQAGDERFEVILFDNGSEDGSAEAIAEDYPEVQLIAESQNLGFAKATNLSAKHARGEYLLLLNTDTVVLDSAIDRLVAFARKRPKAKIWGGRTLFGDGRLNPASAWGRITPWSMFCGATGLSNRLRSSQFFNPEGYGDWRRDDEREVDIVQGSFFLIKRTFWQKLGGFDPAFFMYGEEADLCLRARNLGASPRITPDATITHYGGLSGKSSAQKFVYLLGSRIGLIERHFAPRWRPFGKMMTLFWAWWRSILYRLAAMFSDRHRHDAKNWSEIWQRRGEWRNGPVQPRGD